ncbi:hypothetical protein B0H11DRAFT_1799305 [Mycena galericulata]|nr:hypothetical protein B0H11DRAFT_1799305 [Mycena galericulata]
MHLPDEIISEILKPVFHFPDDLFSDTFPKTEYKPTVWPHPHCALQPWAYATRPSEALLVCKAWLRVATHLLYNVVIFSKAQARALDTTLKKNPGLGRFIRKIRVEGGFGASMHGILRNTPNVTDICLSLHLHAGDRSTGLVKGLPLIHPTRVTDILCAYRSNGRKNLLVNKQVSGLVKILKTCAQEWSTLTTIIFPYWDHRASFITSMARASSVTTLSFPVPPRLSFPRHILEIAKDPSIRLIEIRGRVEEIFMPNIPGASRLKSIVRSANKPPPYVPRRPVTPFLQLSASSSSDDNIPSTPNPHPVPSFSPMASAPQTTVDLVWKRILFFAMNTTAFSVDETQQTLNAQLQYLLVSKQFYNLGLPYLYRSPVLSTNGPLQKFTQRIVAAPALGVHLRELTTYRPGGQSHINPPHVLQTPIFSHTPYLTHLVGENGVAMDWDTFRTLAEVAGPTLVELALSLVLQEGDTPDPDVFHHFVALHSLRWHGDTFDIPSTEMSQNLDAALPALEVLQAERTAYPLLRRMNLPRLRELRKMVGTDAHSFLGKHGSKVRTLEVARPALDDLMALCPNLCIIDIDLGILDPTELLTWSYPPQHYALAKITINKLYARRKTQEEAEWDLVFFSIRPGHFPALRELQVAQCEWPSPECYTSENMWVKAAEKFLEHGITLLDGTGMHWRGGESSE